MASSERSAWRLDPRALSILLLYSVLAPASVYFMSLEKTWSALVAVAGFLLTLPFFPLLAVVMFGASDTGSLPVMLGLAWLVVLLQSWYALSELRVRAWANARSVPTELLALLGRSTVVIAVGIIIALLAMAYHVGHVG